MGRRLNQLRFGVYATLDLAAAAPSAGRLRVQWPASLNSLAAPILPNVLDLTTSCWAVQSRVCPRQLDNACAFQRWASLRPLVQPFATFAVTARTPTARERLALAQVDNFLTKENNGAHNSLKQKVGSLHHSRRALSIPVPFSSLLGKVARSAGWGAARSFDRSRIAQISPRSLNRPYLLSAPHPAFGHLPRFAEKQNSAPARSGTEAGRKPLERLISGATTARAPRFLPTRTGTAVGRRRAPRDRDRIHTSHSGGPFLQLAGAAGRPPGKSAARLWKR
jgi:hypothetical protein